MLGLVLSLSATNHAAAASKAAAPTASTERHLTNIKQLTFGRQNAEAYFSFSGDKLIFQSTNNWMKDTFAAAMHPADIPLGCYQMYVMDLGSEKIRMVSTGSGTTTCGYFFPGDRRVLYSSTHLRGPNCPPKPKREGMAAFQPDALTISRGHPWEDRRRFAEAVLDTAQMRGAAMPYLSMCPSRVSGLIPQHSAEDTGLIHVLRSSPSRR